MLVKNFEKDGLPGEQESKRAVRSQDSGPPSLSFSLKMHSKMLFCFCSEEAMKRREKAEQRYGCVSMAHVLSLSLVLAPLKV